MTADCGSGGAMLMTLAMSRFGNLGGLVCFAVAKETSMAKRPDDKDQTLPKSQGEKEKPERPGKGSKPQNEADRP